MLTLVERRAGHALILGGNMQMILGVVDDQVQVDINVPTNLSVHRNEIWIGHRARLRHGTIQPRALARQMTMHHCGQFSQ
jgi:sRNA-binding carbon storage regulator CsrA